MTLPRWTLAGIAVGAVAIGSAGFVAGRWTPDRPATERIVHDYILGHPEILPQAMERLQARSAANAITTERAALQTPFAGAWAGSPQGDVTLVMFTDYSCGFCKASTPDIERLLREDTRLKVVWRELPVLGPQSEIAARAALAAARQGKYPVFHRTLFAAGRPDQQGIAAATAAAAANGSRLQADAGSAEVTRELQANLALAERLGIGGTPAFVVGDRLLSGAVGYDVLKEAVAAVRARD
jgi:protein-disulfide isomerase